MIVRKIWIFDGKPFSGFSDFEIGEDGTVKAIWKSEGVLNAGDFDGQGRVAVAGLTDAHNHVWQAPLQGIASDMMLIEYLNKINGTIGGQLTAKELYELNLLGYLIAQKNGVTNIFDWCHALNTPEHTDAAVQAAIDSGSNVVFFHGGPANTRETYWNNSIEPHSFDIVRTAKQYSGQANLKIGMGIRGPEFATLDTNANDIALAETLDCPVSMHIGCAVLGKIYKPVAQLQQAGLLTSRLNLVHCNVLSNQEYHAIADAGALMSITPEAELQTGLGNPATHAILEVDNIKWSIGIDIPSGSNESLIFQQRLALQTARGQVNAKLIESDQMPMEMPILANDFFFASMDHANQYAGLNTSAKIEVGKKASFSIFSDTQVTKSSFAKSPVFYYLQERDIQSVFVNGKLTFNNQKHSQFDISRLTARGYEIMEKFR